jgi:hypothetical protein
LGDGDICMQKLILWEGGEFCVCNLIFFCFVGLAYQGKDIVFRFIIEYSRFWPLDNRSIFICGFLKDVILACVET